MSGGLKDQWGVGDAAQVGPDAQSQDLKNAFEKAMDAMADHLQYTAVNGDRARQDPLSARGQALVPRYQETLKQIDAADPAKAKPGIDSLLADATKVAGEAAAFRAETEKAVNDWQARSAAYDGAVKQVEELCAWQHPKEGAVRALADAIRGSVNDHAYDKAVTTHDQFLPKLQPVYEDLQKQKAAQQEYEPALAAMEPQLAQVAAPSFKKLAGKQSEIASGHSEMQAQAQGKDFVAAVAASSVLNGRVSAYNEEVKQIQQAKDQYEAALGGIQPKLQSAPNPSPFKKLEAMQAELSNGQKDMESSVQSEEFEQALQKANDLGTKVDAYSEQIKVIKQAKDQYDAAVGGIHAKLEAAPNPSPFKKLEAMQAELNTGKTDMESAATSEEFEQALVKATDLGTKADSYSEQVKVIQQAKDQYDAAVSGIEAKLQSAPNPSPFKKLEAMQAELTTGKTDMESAATSEEFDQALQKANDLGGKADSYTEQVKVIQQAKDQYDAAVGGIHAKLEAAPNPSPFKKLEAMQAELNTGKTDMESAATSEEFEQALQKANDLGTKADSYSEQVKVIQQAKDQYDAAVGGIHAKLNSAPNPSPFKKLEAMQAELTTGKTDMESAATSEEFEQALQKANDLGTKADAYSVQVNLIQQAKDQYEQVATGIQAKVQAAPNPSPFKKLEAMQAELSNGQKDMESSVQSEEFEQALQKANDLGTKVDAYSEQVKVIQQAKDQYEQVWSQVQAKAEAARGPGPFPKTFGQKETELAELQGQMGLDVADEKFDEALQKANKLGTDADAITAGVAELQRQKAAYEQAWAQVQAKVEAARGPCPFPKTFGQQETDIAVLQGQMGLDVEDEKFDEALQKANKLGTDADAITAGVAELQRKKADYEQTWGATQAKLNAVPRPSPFLKLAPQQEALVEGQGQVGFAVEDEKFEQALQIANDLSTKADAYTEQVKQIQQAKDQYQQKLGDVQTKLQSVAASSPPEPLRSMHAQLTAGEREMESAAQNEDFEAALKQATDLLARLDAYAVALTALEAKKKEYEEKFAALQPQLDKALEPKGGKSTPAQDELAALKKQVETVAQSGDDEQALKLLDALSKKLEAVAKEPAQSGPAQSGGAEGKPAKGGAAGDAASGDAPPASNGGDTERLALTFDVGPVDYEFGKWGADSHITGSFKFKGKGKGELVTKGSGKKASVGGSTDGGHKSEVEIGVQKAKELGSDGWKEVFSTIRLKELKESFKDEVTDKKIEISLDIKATFESSVAWLSPVLSGKFVIAGAEWEKIKKDPFAFTVGGIDVAGGVEAKGPLPLKSDTFDANISAEFTGGGSAKLNWPFIMRKMLKKYGERALQKVAEQGAKVVAEEAAKQGAKEVVKQGTKEVAKQGAKEVAEQGAKEVAKDAAIAATEGAGEAVLVMDSAALASAAAAVLLPAAVAAVIIAGVCQEVANMRADSEAIATALPARNRAAKAAGAYARTMTGGNGSGEGAQYAETQIADMMSKSNATREQVVQAVTGAKGGYAAIRERELKRLKDQMYDAACQAFDKGHEPFSFPESRGSDWGYRASFRKMLSLILYADD